MKTWCYRHPNAVVVLLVCVLLIFVAANVANDVMKGPAPWWRQALRLGVYLYMVFNIERWWRRT